VVAGEVRELAQRSAQSAKEIKDLIARSLAEVSGGSQAVRDAGATIDDVVNGVRRGAALMGEISHVTREQSIGLQLVNRTLATMDGVTQQNATLVEESLAAIMSLQEQAERLARSASVFRLASAEHEQLNVIDVPLVVTAKPKPRPATSGNGLNYLAGLV
jgi:methyl-accepting chemotaxis protein